MSQRVLPLIAAALGVFAASPVMAEAATSVPLIAALSESDRSVLDASLSTSQIALMTSEGSANDALWSELAKRGSMERLPDQQGEPVGVKLKMFGLTDAGRRTLPGVLHRVAKP